jgi:hypothetical protein
MISLLEDRQPWPVVLVDFRAFLITTPQYLSNAGIEFRHGAFELPAHLCERSS